VEGAEGREREEGKTERLGFCDLDGRRSEYEKYGSFLPRFEIFLHTFFSRPMSEADGVIELGYEDLSSVVHC